MTITLNDQDAIQYQEFCKYYDKFQVLKNSGSLDTTAGSVTIHFDHESVIRKIERDNVLYIRKDIVIVK